MQSNDAAGEPIMAIINWDDTVTATRAGNSLEVTDIIIMQEDVTNPKSAIANRAEGTEYQTAHAIAKDPKLREKYGELHVANGGHGVVFRFGDQDVPQVDGLVKNCNTLFLSKTKLSLDERDVDKLASAGIGADGESGSRSFEESISALTNQVDCLEFILKHPRAFQSVPREVMSEVALFAEKPLVPIASGFHLPRLLLAKYHGCDEI